MHIWCEFSAGLDFGSKLGFRVVLLSYCTSDWYEKQKTKKKKPTKNNKINNKLKNTD